MKKINDSLLKFFAENYKPGSIGLVGTTTPENIAQASIKSGATRIYKPPGDHVP